MTMISVRLAEDQFQQVTTWAETLEVDRSSFIREAIRRRLAELQGPIDAERWLETPLSENETALEELDEWGPADDWSDWE